ncbi:MAG: FG-GAP-like repeat-containing protein, partial [Terracidiphilus sp.]
MKFFRMTWCLGLWLAANSCFAQSNPVPFVDQPLVPGAVAPGGPGFSLTIRGAGFVSGSKVNWNGTPLATTFVGAGKLSAVVPAGNVSTPGTANVTVVSPGPGGGSSSPVPFTITTPTSDLVFSALPVGGTTSPISAVAADFNHDGIPDLAVIDQAPAPSCNYQNFGVGSIAIFLGNGDGTFTKHSTLCFPDYTGETPQTLAVAGDINRDGRVDLVAVSHYEFDGDEPYIYYGNGDGTFTAPVEADGSGFIYGLALGGFYNDGQLSIAVSDANYDGVGEVLLFPEDGAPFFNPEGVGAGPLSSGDFNGDGVLDLASASKMFLNDGDGGFTQLANVPSLNGASIVSGDFNGDGILDLASTNGNSISVLLGNGDGTFTQKGGQPTSAQTNVDLITADFNGDGILDFAVIDSANVVSFWLGNGDGTFKAPVDSTGRGDGVAAADFNDDGRMDLAVTNSSTATVTVLFQATATCGNPSQNSPYSGTYNVPPTKLPLVITWTNPTSVCELHYTTDGSAPTASSPAYPEDGLSIDSTTTIRVIATAAGYNNSAIIGGKWTLNLPRAATPTFSPASPYTGPATIVAISDSTPSHTITYCASNSGTCTPSTTGASASFGSSGPTNICAFANATGYTQSATACWAGTYVISTCGNPSQNAPYSGTYKVPPTTLPLVITWTNPTSGCVLHYTTNGSAPTASSPTYPASGLSIYSTTEIRVIAAAPGYHSSAIIGGKWTLDLSTCGNPSQNAPYSGTYKVPPTTLPLVITWTNPTSGCVLHYTTNGSAPTASSPTYPVGGLSIYSTTTIRVIATGTGFNSSNIIGGKWSIN